MKGNVNFTKFLLKIGKLVTLFTAQDGWPLWTMLKPRFYC